MKETCISGWSFFPSVLLLVGLITGCATSVRDIHNWESQGGKKLNEIIAAFDNEDNSIKVRVEAAKALVRINSSDVGNDEAIKALSERIRYRYSKYSEVNVATVQALGTVAKSSPDYSYKVNKVLYAALRNKDAITLHKAAIQSLIQIGDSNAVATLSDAMRDNLSNMNRIAGEALLKIGTFEAVSAALKSGDSAVVKQAADILIQTTGATMTITALSAALGDKNSDAHIAAGKALIDIGTVDALAIAIKEGNPDISRMAAKELVRLGDAEAIKTLSLAMMDEKEEVRVVAAETLGEIRDPETIEVFSKALKDENSRVSSIAGNALLNIGTSEAILHALRGGNPSICKRAAVELVKLGNPEAINTLSAAMMDENKEVRIIAIQALGEIKDPAAIGILSTAQEDKDMDVCISAGEALLNIGTTEALFRVMKDGNWNNPSLCQRATDGLVAMGSPDAIAAISRVLENGDVLICKAAANALVEIGTSDAIAGLSKVLESGDEQQRQIVVDALITLANPCAVAVLAKTLKSEDKQIRQAGVDALVKIGSAKALDELSKTLESGDNHLGQIIVDALVVMGNPDAIAIFVKALKSEDKQIRQAGVDAFVKIGNSDAITTLSQALESLNPEIRQIAGKALLEIGSIDALSEILKYGEPSLSHTAAKTLMEMGNVDALSAILEHGEASIRQNAAERLMKIGDIDALSAVSKYGEPPLSQLAEEELSKIPLDERLNINISLDYDDRDKFMNAVSKEDKTFSPQSIQSYAKERALYALKKIKFAEGDKNRYNLTMQMRFSIGLEAEVLADPRYQLTVSGGLVFSDLKVSSRSRILSDDDNKLVLSSFVGGLFFNSDVKKVIDLVIGHLIKDMAKNTMYSRSAIDLLSQEDWLPKKPFLYFAVHGSPMRIRQDGNLWEALGEIGIYSPAAKDILKEALTDPDRDVVEEVKSVIDSTSLIEFLREKE